MEVMWQAWSEDKQAVFHAGFVGQQIDLKHYSKPNRQPMKGTKQWCLAVSITVIQFCLVVQKPPFTHSVPLSLVARKIC